MSPEELVDGTPPPFDRERVAKRRAKKRKARKPRVPREKDGARVRTMIFRLSRESAKLIQRVAQYVHQPQSFVFELVASALREAEGIATEDLINKAVCKLALEAHTLEDARLQAIANALQPHPPKEVENV